MDHINDVEDVHGSSDNKADEASPLTLFEAIEQGDDVVIASVLQEIIETVYRQSLPVEYLLQMLNDKGLEVGEGLKVWIGDRFKELQLVSDGFEAGTGAEVNAGVEGGVEDCGGEKK